MNTQRLTDLRTMLMEIQTGTWRPSNTERLREAGATGLSDVGFDLGYWVHSEEGCGTTACALGSALLDDRFPTLPHLLSLSNVGDLVPCMYAEYFNLSHKECSHLFMPGSYKTEDQTEPTEVVARIDVLLSSDPEETLEDYMKDYFSDIAY